MPGAYRRSSDALLLAVFELVQAILPRLDLFGTLLISCQKKARRAYSRKPSSQNGSPGFFCDLLKLFEGYFRKRVRI